MQICWFLQKLPFLLFFLLHFKGIAASCAAIVFFNNSICFSENILAFL